uniref:Acetylcholinesterase n=1 Tax=Anopheles epiroticus TaxID=199890 RepID=A0A182PNF0_9DIPT
MIVPSLLLFVMHCVVSCTSSGSSPLLVRAALTEPNCASGSDRAGGPRVCVEDGCLVGTQRNGMAGEQFQAFLGIPFAQPPVGKLRFADPIPNGPWNDQLYNASYERAMCLQRNDLLPNPPVTGSEDCLYLNVYRPTECEDPSHPNLPVIVYIHGGGFFSGTASSLIVGPEFILDTKRAILVTIQYRLGVLGFLSTGDSAAPGNFGLKDQALALRWVKRNIKSFGGNDRLITIVGQSAGATSVHMHMISRQSRGLFHRAIMMSGNSLVPWNIPTKHPLALARSTAVVVDVIGADRLSSKSLIAALRKIPGEKLVGNVYKLKSWSVDPLTLFRPVIESTNSPNAFLTEDPRVSWRSGNYHQVPYLAGFVPNEGAIRALAIFKNPELFNELRSNFSTILPILLEHAPSKSLIPKMRSRFFNDTTDAEPIRPGNLQGFTDLYSEASFIYPIQLGVKQYITMANTDRAPANMYKFSYKGRYSYSVIYAGGDTADYGVVHCDDLNYLFRQPAIFPDYPAGSPELKMVDTFVNFIIDFAINGRATPLAPYRDCKNDNQVDQSLNCDVQEFVRVGNDVQVKVINVRNEEMFDFWNGVSLEQFTMLLGAQLILAVVCLAVVLPVSRAALPSGENVPRVCITDGCMRGLWMRSLHGERYEAFMGIPFAKPPVGELRFANPVPNDPWPERELDASGRIPRPACLQQNLFLPERGVEGQEDCLYLNVYRPEKIGNRSSTTSLPTLVYIHGGGFQAGYSSPLVLGAEKLMDNTVILVTIAYRVGAFGFLSTGDEAASGNFGLKDQRQALRWVHRNIAAFGGDPQLVTIMGHSAGGASVHLQLMHLGNEGLFQRAISLSGSALAPWCAPKPNPQQLARKQAQFLDIDEAHNMTTTELVEALRKVDADVFVRSYRQFLVDSEYSVLVYGPVVEAPTVVDAFLTESPKEQWARGAHLSVPWLTGFVPNDGFVFIAPTLKEADCSQETSARQKALLLNVLDGTKQKDLLPMVMERYFGNQSTYVECLTEDNVDKLTMIFNEALFLYPLMLSVRQHANHTGLKSPIYLYKFNYKGPYSYSSIFVPEQDESQDYGIVHCDELIYIFRAPILFPDFRRNSPDAKVTQVMTKLIVDFARTGTEPTGQSDSSQITAQADADIQKVSTDGDSKIAVDSAFPQVLELLNSNSTEQPVLKRYANFYDAEMFEFWTRFYSY